MWKYRTLLRSIGTKVVPNGDNPWRGTVRQVGKAMFGKYLLLTNTVSAGVLMSIGDWASQELEYRKGIAEKRFDAERNAKMFVVGAIQGPIHHYFYGWLDRAYQGATTKIAIIKIMYDQFVMSPVCIAAFFYSAGYLDGKNTSECNEEFLSKCVKVYITDWIVWPATQFINFYYLRPKYRVVYVNFITMMYNVFLSYVKHVDGHQGHEAKVLPILEKNDKEIK